MTKKRNQRSIVWVTIVLVLAIGGLLMINTDGVDAYQKAGQIASGEAAPTSFPASAPIGAVVKMISALVVVVICIYGGIYLLKRIMYGRNARKGRTALLEVIETTHVGPKKTVSLVRVADKSVLVGVTENQISMLTELDADETAVVLAREEEVEETRGFEQLIGAATDKLRKLTLNRRPTTQEG